MKILISGTPGTGKTSISKKLANSLGMRYISINDFAKENNMLKSIDKKRDCYIIDEKKLAEKIKEIEDDVIIEGHLAHFCTGDLIIILRANPDQLKTRLAKRKWRSEKIRENIEAEILGNCLIESSIPEKTIEFDTSSSDIETCAAELETIIRTKKYQKYRPGAINWIKYIDKYQKKNINI
ncbi:MAG: adenylate kinase family protein [Candidatus Aenigmarchaeota archaeon]|nr:adenylate kinase family protein [Candidatus Aenigmarchaeota archaeon]